MVHIEFYTLALVESYAFYFWNGYWVYKKIASIILLVQTPSLHSERVQNVLLCDENIEEEDSFVYGELYVLHSDYDTRY